MHPFLQAYHARQKELSGAPPHYPRPYYQASAVQKAISKPVVYKASKKKQRSKEDGNGTEDDDGTEDSDGTGTSSEGDGDGGHHSKKKKNRCWDGYKPTPGVEAYAEGSCQKA